MFEMDVGGCNWLPVGIGCWLVLNVGNIGCVKVELYNSFEEAKLYGSCEEQHISQHVISISVAVCCYCLKFTESCERRRRRFVNNLESDVS
jgi:hypothetical protein